MVSQTCPICQEAASKRCGGCHQVFYCGKDHQKLDWLRHKLACKPFKICVDFVLGRHLIATRDIKAGEVVLREAPLIRGPCQVTGPVCLGCLQGLSQHNSEPCSRCGWPLCRRAACRQSEQHLPECRWAVDKRKAPVKISQFIIPHPSYECITALRMCYTKQTNPHAWSRLGSLQSHTEERRGSMNYQQDTKSVAQFLRRFYKLEDEFTDDEVMEMLGIIQVNGHEVPVTQPPHVAVYDLASLLEHSCLPNCSKSFTSEGAIIIRAAVQIPQGGHVSICYTDCLWGTVNRQFHLLDTKFFSCTCPRCIDPTEFGTFYSALICDQKGCSGPVLPRSLTSVTADTMWLCGRCSHTKPDHDVGRLLQQTGQELTTLASQPQAASDSFLDRWAATYSRHHYYMTECRLALAQRLGQDSTQGVQGLSEYDLLLKIDLCRQLLQLLNGIAPAECRVLGTLHFELHASLAERARRAALNHSADLQSLLLESSKCLDRTIYFLEQEPDVLPEGQLLHQAKRNKAELDKTLQALVQFNSSIPSM